MKSHRDTFSIRQVVLVILVPCQVQAGTAPKLDHLFPPGAQRGKSVSIKASGTFDSWPVGCWVSQPGITIGAAKSKGDLEITVDAQAQPGPYWIRLYDGSGATAQRPFVVGLLPDIVEKEPNDGQSHVQSIDGPAIINGRLEKNGDLDCYAVTLHQGQTVVASLAAHQILGSPMDSVLQVCSDQGFVLDQNDDARGLDPQLVFRASREGTYLIRVFAFPAQPNSSIRFAGGNDYIYRLTLTTAGFVDHAVPLTLCCSQKTKVELRGWNISPDDSTVMVGVSDTEAETRIFQPSIAGSLALPAFHHPGIEAFDASSLEVPQELNVPSTVTGSIDQPNHAHFFSFHASKGQKLEFLAESASLGYLLDPYLQLFDSSGKMIADMDDVSSDRDPRMTHLIKADGVYRLSIQDRFGHGGFRYVYRLSITEAKPSFSLQLDNDVFTLTTDEPLEIPVKIIRTNDCDAKIVVQLESLPEGVVGEPIESSGNGKSVKLRLSSDGTKFTGPIRVIGKFEESSDAIVASFAVTGVGARQSHAWLTVLPGEPSNSAEADED